MLKYTYYKIYFYVRVPILTKLNLLNCNLMKPNLQILLTFILSKVQKQI